MQRSPSGAESSNLGAAREAIGDNDRIRRALIDRRNQHALADSARNRETALAVAERARHPAAAGIRHRDLEIGRLLHERELGGHADQRFLMTMAMEKRTP